MTTRYLIAIAAGLLLGMGAAFSILPEARAWLGSPSAAAGGKALVGGPFELADTAGRPVTDKDFRGRYMLVFFGFTHCPDVCPSGLQTMAAALDALGDKASRVAPVFITLDPERDTPDLLGSYVKAFDPRITALTGTPDQIRQVAKAYRVYFKKVESAAKDGSYSIDHTAVYYLMSPQGDFAAPIAYGVPADRMAEQLRRFVG